MAEKKVPAAKVGEMWKIPSPSVVTGPGGTRTVIGGRYCLQHTGTYTNDTGDAITVVADVVEPPKES